MQFYVPLWDGNVRAYNWAFVKGIDELQLILPILYSTLKIVHFDSGAHFNKVPFFLPEFLIKNSTKYNWNKQHSTRWIMTLFILHVRHRSSTVPYTFSSYFLPYNRHWHPMHTGHGRHRHSDTSPSRHSCQNASCIVGERGPIGSSGQCGMRRAVECHFQPPIASNPRPSQTDSPDTDQRHSRQWQCH